MRSEKRRPGFFDRGQSPESDEQDQTPFLPADEPPISPSELARLQAADEAQADLVNDQLARLFFAAESEPPARPSPDPTVERAPLAGASQEASSAHVLASAAEAVQTDRPSEPTAETAAADESFALTPLEAHGHSDDSPLSDDFALLVAAAGLEEFSPEPQAAPPSPDEALRSLTARLRRKYADEYQPDLEEMPRSLAERVRECAKPMLVWPARTIGSGVAGAQTLGKAAGDLAQAGMTRVTDSSLRIAGKLVSDGRKASEAARSFLQAATKRSTPSAGEPRLVLRVSPSRWLEIVLKSLRMAIVPLRWLRAIAVAAGRTGSVARQLFAGQRLTPWLVAASMALLVAATAVITLSLASAPASSVQLSTVAGAAASATSTAIMEAQRVVRGKKPPRDIELLSRRRRSPRKVIVLPPREESPIASAAVATSMETAPRPAVTQPAEPGVVEPSAIVATVGILPEPSDGIYTRSYDGVRPPVALTHQVPTRNSPYGPRTDLTALELVVGETGDVESVRLTTRPSRLDAVMLLSAAKAWKFRPATREGKPVRYRLQVSVPHWP